MKNILLFFFCLALGFSLYSCQKDTATPVASTEEYEYVDYDKTFVVSDRGTNTAGITWSVTPATAFVDAQFEVTNASTSAYIGGYGWINSNGGTYTTPSFTSVATGGTIKLHIRARQRIGSNPLLSYSFSSTCGILGGTGSGSFTVSAPAGTPWASIPANAYTTQACL